MHVNLTPQLEEMVREKVASGLYNNASEVIREALRIMGEHERVHREVLKAALAIGQAQLDRGEGIPYTAASLDTIKRNAVRKLESGRKPKADVCP
jgi:antitoxin ParD1/3/4